MTIKENENENQLLQDMNDNDKILFKKKINQSIVMRTKFKVSMYWIRIRCADDDDDF